MNELSFEAQLPSDHAITLKLIGIGGSGSNAVGRLVAGELGGLKSAVINTDLQSISASPVEEKLLIGAPISHGLSAGGDPAAGREAAEADREKIAALVKDTDLVFLVAGLGGGTGTGASPIVAEIAAEQGALVIAFVTLPFSFERGRRLKQAEEGLQALRRVCDAVIPLPNDLLLQEADEKENVMASFARSIGWIGRGVNAIRTMLLQTGLINIDFAALRQVFQAHGGKTLFGFGVGGGDNPAADAMKNLRLCPLLAMPESARRADRLLVNIAGGPDLATAAINELMQALTEEFGSESNVVMGASIDEAMNGRIEVVVLGTTDIGGRGRGTTMHPPVSATRQPRTSVKNPETSASEAASEKPSVKGASSSSGSAAFAGKTEAAVKANTSQDEFSFGEVESRGHFENTDRNLFEGQDLDVPTYLRKGIKLVL